ncbi:MAG TPA: hypothetical protein DD420_12930 [Streptomyces sp.]|nr:hypothetical protein [Streptomyces sp.]
MPAPAPIDVGARVPTSVSALTRPGCRGRRLHEFYAIVVVAATRTELLDLALLLLASARVASPRTLGSAAAFAHGGSDALRAARGR